jgi:hypothetical protein
MNIFVFLKYIVNELFGGELQDPDNLIVASILDRWTIGFLAPPNQRWPTFLKSIRGSKWSTIDRVEDSMKVDAIIRNGMNEKSPPVSIECKDHKKPIDSSTLVDILVRAVIHNSRLHLVITNNLQRKYFTSKNDKGSRKFEAEITKKFRENNRVLKISSVNGLPTVSEVSGVNWRPKSPQRLIIFLETGFIHSDLK